MPRRQGELVHVKALAALMDVSPRTVHAWLRRGEVLGVRIANVVRVWWPIRKGRVKRRPRSPRARIAHDRG